MKRRISVKSTFHGIAYSDDGSNSDGNQKKKKSPLCDNFLKATSIWSLPNIAAARSRALRLTWISIFVLGVALTAVILTLRVMSYYERETYVDLRREIHYVQRLPAITICNANRFFLDDTSRADLADLVNNLNQVNPSKAAKQEKMDKLKQDCAGNPNRPMCKTVQRALEREKQSGKKDKGNSSNNNSNKGPRSRISNDNDTVSFAPTIIRGRSERSVTEEEEMSGNTIRSDIMSKIGWRMDQNIYHCRLLGIPCAEYAFRPVLTNSGLCWRLKADDELGAFGLSRDQMLPGNGNGLLLYVGVDAANYDAGQLSNGANFEVGLKVAVHNDDEPASPDYQSISASVGRKTTVSIERVEYKDMSPPYGDCDPNAKLAYETKSAQRYSYSACVDQCQIRYYVESCDCVPYWVDEVPASLQDSGKGICGLSVTMDCISKAMGHFVKEYGSICQCQAACVEVGYDKRVSTSRFPTDGILVATALDVDIPPPEIEKKLSTEIAAIDIHFGNIFADRYMVRPEQEMSDLLADIGGDFGLFIGLTVFTLVEVIELAILWLFSKCGFCLVDTEEEDDEFTGDPKHDGVGQRFTGLNSIELEPQTGTNGSKHKIEADSKPMMNKAKKKPKTTPLKNLVNNDATNIPNSEPLSPSISIAIVDNNQL